MASTQLTGGDDDQKFHSASLFKHDDRAGMIWNIRPQRSVALEKTGHSPVIVDSDSAVTMDATEALQSVLLEEANSGDHLVAIINDLL